MNITVRQKFHIRKRNEIKKKSNNNLKIKTSFNQNKIRMHYKRFAISLSSNRLSEFVPDIKKVPRPITRNK